MLTFIKFMCIFYSMGWFGRRKEARISRKSQRDIKNAESLEEKIEIEIKLPKGIFDSACDYLEDIHAHSTSNCDLRKWYVKTYPKNSQEILSEVNKRIDADKERNYKNNLNMIVKNLSQREKQTNYKLSDVIKHPLKYCTKGFSEASSDPFAADITIDNHILDRDYTEKNKVKSIRKLRFYSCILAAFGATSVPHELIHAGVNKLTGGVNHEIAINKFFGGDIVHYFIPEVQAKWMIPMMGGYVKFDNPSYLGKTATVIAPYIMTPLGIYLLNKSKEKKNLVMAYLGGGLVAGHAGGIIGDFFGMGNMTIDKLFSSINPQYSPDLITNIAGFCLGTVILSYTYRLSKGTVNSLQQRKS